MAKMLLDERKSGAYYNWDDISVRRQWNRDPKSFIPSGAKKMPLVVFDEIHKIKTWKRTLKGVYDTLQGNMDILVTSSSRLDTFRKGGDSLMGRYYQFRLHPLSLREMSSFKSVLPPDDIHTYLMERAYKTKKSDAGIIDILMRFGGFPEPFLLQSRKKWRLWRQMRMERLIREDIRDLTRITELSNIEIFCSLLPEKVSSSLSLNSLREDLEVSYDTVRRWHLLLQDMYYHFEIKPYHHSVIRAIKKEGKVYLWDYSEVRDPAARFENMVAAHLLKSCHFWQDTGEGMFQLTYVKNKERQEIDFLIVRDNKPWLPIEVKFNSTYPSACWTKFMPKLKCRLGVQLVTKPGVWEVRDFKTFKLIIASAVDFLLYLV